MFATTASRWILRANPLNTVPGPTSTYARTPSDARRPITSSHRTGADTCAINASMDDTASRLGIGVDVGDDGHARIRRGDRPQLRRQAFLRGSHERTVEGRTHRESDDPFRTHRSCPFARSRDRGGRACNHHLTGRIQIRRSHHVAFFGGSTGFGHLPGIQPENRRHRTSTHRHGFLHVTTAAPYNREGIGEGQGAGRDVGAVLAETVTSHDIRPPSSGSKQPAGGDADRKNGGLGVLRQSEPIGRALEAERADGLAKGAIGLGKCLCAHREGLGQRAAHAHLLRTLSREQKGYQLCDTVTAAISCSSCRSSGWVANREAIATAFRTALADDRPWPTIARPATPSSGTPPYSE